MDEAELAKQMRNLQRYSRKNWTTTDYLEVMDWVAYFQEEGIWFGDENFIEKLSEELEKTPVVELRKFRKFEHIDSKHIDRVQVRLNEYEDVTRKN